MLELAKVQPGFYTPHAAELLEVFASQVVLAIENDRLYEQVQQELTERIRLEKDLRHTNESLQLKLTEIDSLQIQLREQAIRDPLTGLLNRRYLDEMLDRELGRSLRERRLSSLIMMDIDYFRQLNDRFGHKAGDLMLQVWGEILLLQTRSGDLACRYGGEEFLVVMPGAPLAIAHQRAEQWRQTFEALRIDYEHLILQTTLSLGVAEFPTHGATGTQVLQAVDQALHAAKASGRNKVNQL